MEVAAKEEQFQVAYSGKISKLELNQNFTVVTYSVVKLLRVKQLIPSHVISKIFEKSLSFIHSSALIANY